jgi:hypothetical protein
MKKKQISNPCGDDQEQVNVHISGKGNGEIISSASPPSPWGGLQRVIKYI